MKMTKELNNKKYVGADASVCPSSKGQQNKGITLIGLVITVIIMLILVSLTIAMAINGGLFEKAGEAVGKTQNEIDVEQQLANGRIQIDGKVYNSIDEYLKGMPAEELPATEYGKTVNYGVTYEDASTYGEGKWEIFYADENNIYIITKGHLAKAALDYGVNSGEYKGTEDFTDANLSTKFLAVKAGALNKTYDPTSVGSELKYPSDKNNMKATEYLLDSTKWTTYRDTNYADWAIGGPTYELFVNSYNAYYPNTEKADVALEISSENGYCNPLSARNSVPIGTHLNHSSSTSYWLACPSNSLGADVRFVFGRDAYVSYYSWGVSYAFRPVVCLKPEVSLRWNSTTNQYDLVK